jgi:hypothetical protein
MTDQPEKTDALFVNLVLMFKTAAMQQMGKIVNPLSGEIERNLDQARFSIDMIDMLREKTRGNLTDEIAKLLDSTLTELRMNYVDEADKSPESGEEARADQDAGADAEGAAGGKEESGGDDDTGDPRPSESGE